MTAFFAKLKRVDWFLFVCMAALSVMGVRFIESAGGARASAVLQDLWIVHGWTAGAGLALCLALACVDYRKIMDWCAGPFYGVALAFLVAVLAVGSVRYGGKRWLWFFQPSELSKVAVILLVAHVFGRAAATGPDAAAARLFGWRGAAWGLGLVGVPAVLILAEPDLGTALVLVPTVLAMLLAARVWTRGLVALLCAGVLAAGVMLGAVYAMEKAPPEKREHIAKCLPLKDHQVRRLRVFLFPERDILGDGYNLRQAKLAIASGGWRGKGHGEGSLKQLGYLPPTVSMNDFIFAVLAEESGFTGCLLLLALYAGVLFSGLKAAFRAQDDRGRLLAIGVSTLLFCHVYVNVAMSIGLMPITGLPLPFISAGRTFLVVVMAGFGLVQSVAVHGGGENRPGAGAPADR